MTLSKLSRNWTPDDEGQKREDKLMSANVKTQSFLLVSAEGGAVIGWSNAIYLAFSFKATWVIEKRPEFQCIIVRSKAYYNLMRT